MIDSQLPLSLEASVKVFIELCEVCEESRSAQCAQLQQFAASRRENWYNTLRERLVRCVCVCVCVCVCCVGRKGEAQVSEWERLR